MSRHSSANVKQAPSEEAPVEKTIAAEDRHRMIAEAAYYLAEKHGFAGDSQAEWLEAEAQIEAQLTRRP